MTMGKGIFVILATLFAMALALKDGNVPEDPVFDCLSERSEEAYLCYKRTYGFVDSRRGGRLGTDLGQLVPKDYKTWPAKSDSERAQVCIKALKNFVAPLSAVVHSEINTNHVCHNTGNELNKTLSGLLRVVSQSTRGIRFYVLHKGVAVRPLQLNYVNMTAMTHLASQQLRVQTPNRAVHLRNYVLLDYLSQVIRDIRVTRGCFNTGMGITFGCHV